MNSVNLLARITSDLKLETAKNDNKYLRFSVAYNRNYKNSNGEWEQKSSFFNCVAFGYNAERIANYFKKGDRILIDGSLEQNTYNKDGEVISKLVIMVANVDIIEKRQSQSTSNSEKPNNSPKAQNNYNHSSNADYNNANYSDNGEIPF